MLKELKQKKVSSGEARVYMVYKPLDKPIKIEEQDLKPFKRTGFTVIEWGGTEVK